MKAASAPGKLVIVGEYAVLHGGVAMVAAVSRRVRVSLAREDDGVGPEVDATRRLGEARGGRALGPLRVDASALREGEAKLGLGSSAAASVATAFLVGSEGADATARTAAMQLALAGHRAVAPLGSGIDVAASALGGFLRFETADGTPRVAQLRFPDSLHASVVWSGGSARTSDLLAMVDALAAARPDVHRDAMQRIADAARGFVDGLASGDADALVSLLDEHGEAMRALGVAAGAPIVTDALAEIATLARSAGGAAKPSGAGGGDVALACFRSAPDRARFEAACAEAGFRVVPLELGAPGVRAEAPSAS